MCHVMRASFVFSRILSIYIQNVGILRLNSLILHRSPTALYSRNASPLPACCAHRPVVRMRELLTIQLHTFVPR